MKKLNSLGETVVVSSDNMKLDETVKKILAEKSVLAWILSAAVEEFRSLKSEKVIPYLSEIAVSRVPIMPGSTNSEEVVEKLPEESKFLREGIATYDVRFYATSPKGGKSPAEYRLIMNLEGQKVQKPGYDLTTRGIVYCARQISEQLGRNIRYGRYQNVEKVYSIWVVMDCTQESANTISQARWIYEDLAGHYDYHPRIDIERVVIIRLPKDDEWKKAKNRPQPVHEMLATLLSNAIQPAEKLEVLNKYFDMPMTETLQQEVENMCNYSSVIRNESRNEGYAEGQKEIAVRMIRAGESDAKIEAYTGLDENRIKRLREEELAKV